MMAMCLSLAFVIGASACSSCASCGGATGDTSSESSSNQGQSSSTPDDSLSESSSDQGQSSSTPDDSLSESSSNQGQSSSTPDDNTSSSVGDSTDSSVGGDDTQTKTDEEIFAEIKAAVLSTQSYNGAFSMDFREENRATGDEGYEAGYFTCNPETLELALDGMDEKYRTCEKTFEKDGKYYFCGVNGMADEIQPEDYVCEETTANRVKANQANYLDYYAPWAFMGNYGSFAIADSYAELLEALAIVSADTMADMATDGYDNPQSTCVVDLGTEGDKSWITFTINGSHAGDPDDTTSEYQSKITMKFIVEGGYVISVEQDYYACSDGQWGKEMRDLNVMYAYTYAFDQAFFDSIIPCEPQAKTEYFLQVNLHLLPNYIDEEYIYITAETTKEEILGQLNDLFWDIPEDLDLEMDAWYLDEACTVKFDPDAITDLMEYEKITDLYAKSVSFNSDYAWVIVEHEYEERYSKPYQIAKILPWNGRSDDALRSPFHLVSEPYAIPDADKVLVDGVETTAESITLEGGKTYVVTRVEYQKDGDYWMFA